MNEFAPGRIPDVSVVTSGHDVADARLHREVAAMVRAGLTVEVLGLGRSEDAPPGTSVRTRGRRSMAVRAVRALAWPVRARGHVVVLLDPDATLGALVTGVGRRRRVVVDVHEDYLALLEDRDWARGVVGRLARTVARAAVAASARADLTVVADDHLRPGAGAARQRLVVRNLPDLDHVGPAPTADDHGADPVRTAVYVGDLRASRGLRTMVEAVAGAPGWHLDLVGPVHAADSDWLDERLADQDLQGRVRVHGRLPPARAWDVARDASVGLVLLDDTPAFRGALPSKLLEYLAAGLAVLATPLPRVATLLHESGAGRLVTGADEASSRLNAWSARPADLAVHRRRAREWATAQESTPSGYDELAARLVALRTLGAP